MLEQLKEDARVNDFRVTPIFIMLIYRFGNSIYYSNINKYIKKYCYYLLKFLIKYLLIFRLELRYIIRQKLIKD